MGLAELERELHDALNRELPGVAGQQPMAPRPRTGWKPGRWPADCRRGAALLLIYPRQSAAHFVLTLRSDTLAHHAAQVSLPGGAVESGETVCQAALREAQEEVGVLASSIRVLGSLSPLHVPVSRYVLHPSVGLVDARPDFRPAAGEVDRILEVPLEQLLDPARARVEERRPSGAGEVPFFHLAGHNVWGATAMVLSEFLAVLGHVPDPRR